MANPVRRTTTIPARATTVSAPSAARADNALFTMQRAVGNQGVRSLLANESRGMADRKPPESAPAHAARPVRLPPLTPERRERMVKDVDSIVAILKSGTPDAGDQTRLLEAVRKYERLDDQE